MQDRILLQQLGKSKVSDMLPMMKIIANQNSLNLSNTIDWHIAKCIFLNSLKLN